MMVRGWGSAVPVLGQDVASAVHEDGDIRDEGTTGWPESRWAVWCKGFVI